jgi:hypothetical protein
MTAILACPALAVVNSVVQGNNLKEFLDRTPEFNSALDIDNFKKVAGQQMRAALAQAALLLVPPGCFFWGLMSGSLSPGDFVWILLPSVIVILVARSFRKLELKAWSLPADTEDLAAQRDRIVRTWKTKALPDW